MQNRFVCECQCQMTEGRMERKRTQRKNEVGERTSRRLTSRLLSKQMGTFYRIKNTHSHKNFTSQELTPPPPGSDPSITSANMAKNWAHETWRVIRKGKYHRWFSSTISHQLRHIFGFCCRFLVLKELISQLESYLGCWYVSMMRKWVIRHTNARRPSGLCASGEWDTRLPIYLNLSAKSFPHRATAATFLSRLSCSPADRTRYSRTDTEGPLLRVLRLNPEISSENREILLAKTTRPL